MIPAPKGGHVFDTSRVGEHRMHIAEGPSKIATATHKPGLSIAYENRGAIFRGVTTGRRERKTPVRFTTLYELIVAIQDLVGPHDDALVVATVVHLLQSQQLTIL